MGFRGSGILGFRGGGVTLGFGIWAEAAEFGIWFRTPGRFFPVSAPVLYSAAACSRSFAHEVPDAHTRLSSNPFQWTSLLTFDPASCPEMRRRA